MTLPPFRSPHAADVGELPRAARLADLAAPPHRDRLAAVLGSWAMERRWFRSKARRLRAVDVRDVIPLGAAEPDVVLVVLEARYEEGDPEEYAVPLARLPAPEMAQLAGMTDALVGRLGSGDEVLVDAMRVPATTELLCEAIGEDRTWQGASGCVVARPTGAFETLRGDRSRRLVATPSHAEQSNTSVVAGERLILKLYRRLESGLNPELEVGSFLTARRFPHVPRVAGSLDYERPGAPPATLAVLQEYRASLGDAWSYTLGVLGDYLDAVQGELPPAVVVSTTGLLALSADPVSGGARGAMGGYLDQARLLGERTAALHLALGSDRADSAFAPEPADASYLRSVHSGILAAARLQLDLLEKRVATLPHGVRADAEEVLRRRSQVDATLARLAGHHLDGLRIRVHGDYHLGQVLYTGGDFVIIDFEGEPGRPLRERRLKASPLVDVAGMLRSFSYAASSALIQRGSGRTQGSGAASLEPWAQAWTAWASGAFLAGYRAVAAGAEILPADDFRWAALLDAFMLQKAVYELEYELNNRPAWVGIPLRGIVGLLEA